MNLRKKIENLILEIKNLEKNCPDSCRLPQNTFYLNENDILCLDREVGESRYPYESDGLVLWARSSGYIEAKESNFNIFKTVNFSEDPSVAFFAGIPQNNGDYLPISVLGVARQLFEPENLKRYVVYSPCCAYYITEINNLIFAVRVHTDEDKHIHFSYVAINNSKEEKVFYMESNIEAILRYAENENFWNIMSKYGHRYEDGTYLLRSSENCMVINTESIGGNINAHYHTVGKSCLLGRAGRTLSNALALKKGMFSKECRSVNSSDIPIAADIIHYSLKSNEEVRREYDIAYYHNIGEAEKKLTAKINISEIDNELSNMEVKEKENISLMKIHFADWTGKVNVEILNRFLKNVQKQVNLCALGKNYVGSFIGVRDVMQQLESSLIWQPKKSRTQILRVLNNILADGRAPRQFSVNSNESNMPKMDLRKFIDQGVWIISTVYTYISYTEDYSILEEECSYYIANKENTEIIGIEKKKDTVLDHLIKIMNYLISNIDVEDGTNCLHVLFGDWNDALDGMGKTKHEGREFGTGVSVMASLQFWQNLNEMIEILGNVRQRTEMIETYQQIADRLEEGLIKYAIDINENGEKRIIHGWGDHISYKIGSWNDPDGTSRISAITNSFWAISGMIKKHPEFKPVILSAFNDLNSKYGIKTFDKPFPVSLYEQAGRICLITEGTYENSSVYVHSSLFSIMSLFILGQSDKAWEEFEKCIVISHDNCTKTPFVMPNSYAENSTYEIDGVSFGDWYTGSGTVLIKNIVKYGFGICPNLAGLTIQTASKMPCNNANIYIIVKGHPINIRYKNNNNKSRVFYVNNVPVKGIYDEIAELNKLFIPTSQITDNMIIDVVD